MIGPPRLAVAGPLSSGSPQPGHRDFFTLRAQAPFAKKEDVRRMLNPSSITHLLPRGFGSSHRSRTRHGQPSMVSCRSRMLVMELVRLQRALRAAMLCSTQSSVFSNSKFHGNFAEFFVRRYAQLCCQRPRSMRSAASLGDTETGAMATW